jgi:hypothetical protein
VYAGNNPLVRVDPTGEWVVVLWAIIRVGAQIGAVVLAKAAASVPAGVRERIIAAVLNFCLRLSQLGTGIQKWNTLPGGDPLRPGPPPIVQIDPKRFIE